MIFLVLFCHFIRRMYASWYFDVITRNLYGFVYLFHMPVFIFISGYFSKNNHSDNYYKKTISRCLIPYLLFDFIYSLIDSGGDIWGSLLGLTTPQWTMWFLLSLFFWRIIVKPFSMFKGAFFLSVLLSLYVGFTEMGSFLSLARTFSFFPYFLAGYLISEQSIEKVRSMKKAYALLCFAFAIVVLIVIQKLDVGFSALYMSSPYKDMSGIASVGVRFLLLVSGFLCIGGFLSIIPEKQSIVSIIGKNSILIYLVHSRIILALMMIPAIQMHNGLASIVFAAVFSAAICLLFGNDRIAGVYHSVIGHISNVFIKKESTPKEI